MHPAARARSAFSLVELSIVLVILGLLVGGVLSGQALIHAAELRAISTEYNKYFAATRAFRDKYFAMPGDMNNATQFWGREWGTADCVTNSGAGVNATTGTCDGNGDSIMNLAASVYTPNQSAEAFQFWRQMALAGLIEGSFSGSNELDGGGFQPSTTNSPKSKQGSLWSVVNIGAYSGIFGLSGQYWTGIQYGNSLATGINPMTPEDLWNIDTKMDDGLPGTGKLVNGPTNGYGMGWGDGRACSVAGPAPTAAYNKYQVTSTYKTCDAWFPSFL